MMRTLDELRKRMTAPPVNASRHHLKEFAREAASQGSDKSFTVLDVGAGRGPYRDLFLFFEEHQQPVDFYRYTRFAWRHMARRAGFKVADISWLEGAYATSS